MPRTARLLRAALPLLVVRDSERCLFRYWENSARRRGRRVDDQTATFYAQQMLAGGQMPTLGMGKAAAQARQKILKKVALRLRVPKG
jgi:hypothetical protein